MSSEGLAPYEQYVCRRDWYPIDNMMKWMVKGIGVTSLIPVVFRARVFAELQVTLEATLERGGKGEGRGRALEATDWIGNQVRLKALL